MDCIAQRRPHRAMLIGEADEVGLVAALGPDLTGRIHLAYKGLTDRRWWRRHYPGWPVPKWDYVSLCGRKGLVLPSPPQPVDCLACQRIQASRVRRQTILGVPL